MEANYQDRYQDPYMVQANEPGRDKGLWSVLGRAIRSTVPERRNDKFDANQPVGGENVPFQKPGFFRALAGDRGGDYNRSAQLSGLDRGIADELADKQANYHTAEQGAELGRNMSLQDKINQFRMEQLGLQGRNSRHNVEARNEGLIEAARLRAGGQRDAARTLSESRRTTGLTPRPLDPTMKKYYEAQAEAKRMANILMQQDIDRSDPAKRAARLAETEAAEKAKPNVLQQGWKSLMSVIGGNASKPAMPPAPAQSAGVIPIDDQDVLELQGGDPNDPSGDMIDPAEFDPTLDEDLINGDEYLKNPVNNFRL